MSEWIDIKLSLPSNNTWVKAKFLVGEWKFEHEWFYSEEYYNKNKEGVTHWKNLTNSEKIVLSEYHE